MAALTALALLAAGCIDLSSAQANDPGAGIGSWRNDPICHGTLAGLDLRTATIAEIQEHLEKGKFTSVELVEAYIARIQALDDKLPEDIRLNGVRVINGNAIQQAEAMDAERAAGTVRGPMHGIPVLLKDNVNTVDAPTTAGSIALGNNMVPKDAGAVTRLREAGAIILGKAELLEWANWGAPDNGSSVGGPQRNAYNGGSASASSSGPGVVASMAFSSIAIGSETSGSILGPTQANGVVGLKTSHGLISGAGVIPIAHYFDVLGPMGRNVYDLAATLSAMAGTDPDDRHSAQADANLPPGGDYTALLSTDALQGVRLGYDESTNNTLFSDSLAVLEELGAVLVPIGSHSIENAVGFTEWAALPNEFHYEINQYLQNEADPALPFKTWHELMLWMGENHPEAHGPLGASGLALASAATPANPQLVEVQAPAAIAASRAAIDSIFDEFGIDAIVGSGSPYLTSGAAAGYPTVMVPMGYDDDRPRGISFFGQQFTDGELLAYGYAYEQATHHRIPPDLFNPLILEGLCEDRPGPPTEGPGAGNPGGRSAGGAETTLPALDRVGVLA